MANRGFISNVNIHNTNATHRPWSGGSPSRTEPADITKSGFSQNPRGSTSPRGYGGTEHLSPGFDHTPIVTGDTLRFSSAGTMSVDTSAPPGHGSGILSESNNLRVGQPNDDQYYPHFYNFQRELADDHLQVYKTPMIESTLGYSVPHHDVRFPFTLLTATAFMPSNQGRPSYQLPESYGRSYGNGNLPASQAAPPSQPVGSTLSFFYPISASQTDIYGLYPQISYQTPGSVDYHPLDSQSPNPGTSSRSLGDGSMRPAFHQTYRDLNSAIPSNPASVDPAALSGPPDQGVSKYPVIEAVYLPPNQPNFNTFIPSSPISTLYNPIPQELPRITRRRSAKTKSANNGKGTHEKYHPYQQRNTARVTQRIGFESISDTGCNIPGCHVLTPTMFESHSGEGSGFIGPLPDTRRVTKEKTKRRPMGEEERAAVRHNRITGVCFRCKKYKEKCRGGFPCERCTKLPLWQPICVSTQFAEKKVFSRGLYRARVSQQIGNVKEWITGTSGGGKVALVSNGFEPILRIHVHEYQAKDSSLLDHIIWRGDERSSFKRYPSTAFGILEEASLHRDLDCYIDEHIPVLMDELSGETQDNIYVETMKTAYRYVQKRGEGASFVLWALRIWAAQIVFFKRPWRIAPHSDTLGMSTITEQDLPKLVGLRPLPRLLNQQLDCIMEKRAAELEHLFLTDLQNRIFRMQPAEWFGIFLAMFVFFSSLERDTWNLETWDTEVVKHRDHPAPRPIEWPLRELPGDFADRNRHLVDTLTSHFRAVTKGHAPFSLEWKKQEIQEKVEGDELVVQYMLSVGAEVKRRADLLKQRIKSQYSRENQDSLNMKFTSRLVFDADP